MIFELGEKFARYHYVKIKSARYRAICEETPKS